MTSSSQSGKARSQFRDWFWPLLLTVAPLLASIIAFFWQHMANASWGLVNVVHDERIQFLGACASAGGALLGLVVATMAILVALPDGPSMTSLRAYAGWRVLQYSLLATALDLLVLLTASLIAIAADGRAAPTLVTVYAPSGVVALAVVGSLFGLVLLNVENDRQRAASTGATSQ